MGPAYRCDNHTQFSCRTSYRCIPLWAVCNGNDDCRDNSDEQGCGMSGEEDTFNVICTKKISSIYKHLGFLKIFSVIMDWFFVVFFFFNINNIV